MPDYVNKDQKQGVLRLQNLAQPNTRRQPVTVDTTTLFRYARSAALGLLIPRLFGVYFGHGLCAGDYHLAKGSSRSGLSHSAVVLTRLTGVAGQAQVCSARFAPRVAGDLAHPTAQKSSLGIYKFGASCSIFSEMVGIFFPSWMKGREGGAGLEREGGGGREGRGK